MNDILAGVLIGLGILILAVIVLDTNRFVVRRYQLNTPKIRKDIKIVMLSDLHNCSFGRNNGKLLAAIDEIHPDQVLIAGDMITGGRKLHDSNVLEFLQQLAARYPVIYGNGNHEQKIRNYMDGNGNLYDQYRKKLECIGLQPKVNEHVTDEIHGVTVYSSQISHDFYTRFRRKPMAEDYLAGILGAPETDTYTILIAHNPDYFPEYAAWGADLVLSGHVHGGIARLPLLGGVLSPAYRLFPKYDGGMFRENNSTMILGRGLGTHTIPIRFLNPGELVVVELHKQGER